jgi:hypothetical protein
MPSSTVTGRFLTSFALEAGGGPCALSDGVAVDKHATTSGQTRKSEQKESTCALILFSDVEMVVMIIRLRDFCDLMLANWRLFTVETDGPWELGRCAGQNTSFNANCIERGPPD